jgi:hypothetical protein
MVARVYAVQRVNNDHAPIVPPATDVIDVTGVQEGNATPTETPAGLIRDDSTLSPRRVHLI